MGALARHFVLMTRGEAIFCQLELETSRLGDFAWELLLERLRSRDPRLGASKEIRPAKADGGAGRDLGAVLHRRAGKKPGKKPPA